MAAEVKGRCVLGEEAAWVCGMGAYSGVKKSPCLPPVPEPRRSSTTTVSLTGLSLYMYASSSRVPHWSSFSDQSPSHQNTSGL